MFAKSACAHLRRRMRDDSPTDNVYFDIETVIGGSGNDSIKGGAANNLLIGNGGNDNLRENYGNDTLSGNAGVDMLDGEGRFDAAINATEDTLINIENDEL